MEAMLVALVIFGVLAAAGGGLSFVPFQTWTFEWRGHRIQIRNHLFSEVILVDGERVGTRRAGDRLTWAEYQLELEGVQLRVWMGTNGATVTCRVDDGTNVIFQSQDLPPSLAPLAPAKALPESEDPRLSAARVLLVAVGEVDRAAAADLEQALVRVLADESAAREAARAHLALGGTEAEAGAVLARRTRAVDELMETLRALHLRVAGADGEEASGPALREAREALSRLDAAREVDAAARRSAAERQAHRTNG